jgi:hypothetical protein
MAITTRQDMVDYLQALRDHAASARSRLPELFKGDTDIRDVAKQVEDMAAKSERLTVEQIKTFAYALRRAADAYEYCFDIAYGFEVWTKNEIKRLMAEQDVELNQQRPTRKENNVVRLPLNERRLEVAEKLTAPGHQDIDAVTAGIERVQLVLPGSYLVVTWITRATSSGYLDAILYLSSFADPLAARQFASSALDLLIAAGAKPEPTAKACGPRLKQSGVPEIARVSARFGDDGKPEESHISAIVLGAFPSGIVGTELVDAFGNARENRALKSFFVFYGSDGGVPPEWLEEDLPSDRPGNPSWVIDQLQPLVGSKKEQLDSVEKLIVKLDTYPSAEGEPKKDDYARELLSQPLDPEQEAMYERLQKAISRLNSPTDSSELTSVITTPANEPTD